MLMIDLRRETSPRFGAASAINPASTLGHFGREGAVAFGEDRQDV